MNSTEPSNPSGVPGESPAVVSPDPSITKLEDTVVAEKFAQGIGALPPVEPLSTVTEPVPPVKSKEELFAQQFGGLVQSLVTEGPAPMPTGPSLTDEKPPIAEIPEIKPENSADITMQPEGSSSAAETTSKPEQTRHEKVMQQIEEILEKYNLTEKKPEEVTV